MRRWLAAEVVALFAVCCTGLLCCRCGASLPYLEPGVVIVEAGVRVDERCTGACTMGYAFCPASFPDAGLPTCEALCTERLGLTPATMPDVLQCESTAPSRTAFVKCGGVSGCLLE